MKYVKHKVFDWPKNALRYDHPRLFLLRDGRGEPMSLASVLERVQNVLIHLQRNLYDEARGLVPPDPEVEEEPGLEDDDFDLKAMLSRIEEERQDRERRSRLKDQAEW